MVALACPLCLVWLQVSNEMEYEYVASVKATEDNMKMGLRGECVSKQTCLVLEQQASPGICESRQVHLCIAAVLV